MNDYNFELDSLLSNGKNRTCRKLAEKKTAPDVWISFISPSFIMGELWRAEEMQLIQLYIQIDAGHDTVEELGKLGAIQFRDV